MAVTMHQLLKTLVDQGGTDLHVTTNSAPQIRVHGKMVPLQTPPMSPAETSDFPGRLSFMSRTRSTSQPLPRATRKVTR